MRLRSLWPALAAATVIAALASAGQSAPYAPKVGQPHPDFTLPRIDNRKPVWLSQFRGKKVLLIHFASW